MHTNAFLLANSSGQLPLKYRVSLALQAVMHAAAVLIVRITFLDWRSRLYLASERGMRFPMVHSFEELISKMHGWESREFARPPLREFLKSRKISYLVEYLSKGTDLILGKRKIR